MEDDNSIQTLFDSLLKDKVEKRIMRLIVFGKSSEEIIEDLLDIRKDGGEK